MITVKGARVSSRLSERKRSMLERAEELGHKFGCVHLAKMASFDSNTGGENEVLCGCVAGKRTVCCNCGRKVK